MDNSEDSIKVGDNYYKFLEKRISQGDADIINFGVKNKTVVEYMNLLLQGANISNYKEDELAVTRLIENDYLLEIDPKYAIDKSTLIDGHCFGFGNFSFKGPIGFVWFDEIVNEEEAVNLSPDPWENMNLLIEYSKEIRVPPVFLIHDHSYFIEGYKVYLDLLVADSCSGEVQYVFDTQEYRKLAEGIVTLKSNELIVDPLNLGEMQEDYMPVVVSSFLMDTEIKKQLSSNLYRVKLDGREGYFVSYNYPYQIRNYMHLENGINKNTKYKEEALDFLNLMYTDEKMINIFKNDNGSQNIRRYCNEWLIHEETNILNSYGEMENYLNRYKDDKLEGFNFNDIVAEMQSSISNTLKGLVKMDNERGIIYFEGYNSYRFMKEDYKECSDKLRKLLEDSGAHKARNYFQLEVDRFVNRQ